MDILINFLLAIVYIALTIALCGYFEGRGWICNDSTKGNTVMPPTIIFAFVWPALLVSFYPVYFLFKKLQSSSVFKVLVSLPKSIFESSKELARKD